MLLAVLLAAHGDGVVVVRLKLVGYAVVGGNAAAVVVTLYAVVVTLYALVVTLYAVVVTVCVARWS